MQDGEEEFMKKADLGQLHYLIESQKSKVQKQMKEMMINNYELQNSLINEEFYEELDQFSEFESKVGLFSVFMFKNGRKYLIKYLNALIHGLLNASRKFAILKQIESSEEIKNKVITKDSESNEEDS